MGENTNLHIDDRKQYFKGSKNSKIVFLILLKIHNNTPPHI
jgi:hypothetical protein